MLLLGMDANNPYDYDDIQDFLWDHDMVDAFSDSWKSILLRISEAPNKSI
jgi:hypothetical protein